MMPLRKTKPLNGEEFYLIVTLQRGEEISKKVLSPPFDRITVGRSFEATIPIADTRVSRIHMVVSLVDGELFIEDHESANGTFINNKKLEINGRVRLTERDVVSVGHSDMTLKFSLGEVIFNQKKLEASSGGIIQLFSKTNKEADSLDEAKKTLSEAQSQARRIMDHAKELVSQEQKEKEERLRLEILKLEDRKESLERQYKDRLNHIQTKLEEEKQKAVELLKKEQDKVKSAAKNLIEESKIEAQKIIKKAEEQESLIVQKAQSKEKSILEIAKKMEQSLLEEAQQKQASIIEKAYQEALDLSDKKIKEVQNWIEVQTGLAESLAHQKVEEFLKQAQHHNEESLRKFEGEIQKKWEQDHVSLMQSLEEVKKNKEDLDQEIERNQVLKQELLEEIKTLSEEIKKLREERSKQDDFVKEYERTLENKKNSLYEVDRDVRRAAQELDAFSQQMEDKKIELERLFDLGKKYQSTLEEIQAKKEKAVVALSETEAQLKQVTSEYLARSRDLESNINFDKKQLIKEFELFKTKQEDEKKIFEQDFKKQIQAWELEKQHFLKEKADIEEKVIDLDLKKKLITEDLNKLHEEKAKTQSHIDSMKDRILIFETQLSDKKSYLEKTTVESNQKILELTEALERDFEKKEEELKRKIEEQEHSELKRVEALVQKKLVELDIRYQSLSEGIGHKIEEVLIHHFEPHLFQEVRSKVKTILDSALVNSESSQGEENLKEELKIVKPYSFYRAKTTYAVGFLTFLLGLSVIPLQNQVDQYVNQATYKEQRDSEIEQKRLEYESKRFQPPQVPQWQESYVDLVIYTENFVTQYAQESYQQELNQEIMDYLYETYKIEEEITIQALSKVYSLITALNHRFQNIHPDFVEENVTQMRLEEDTTLNEVEKLLGSKVRLEALFKAQKKFFEQKMQKP
jgi:hypothetical protein